MATSNHTKRKLFIIILLIISAVLITIYCQAFLETETVFSHLFYIPIILSSFWWGRKGMVVACVLAVVLIGSHQWFQPRGTVFEEILRGMMFLFVSGFVKWCGERILQERDTFSTLLEKTPFGIALVDANDRHLYLNPEFTRITGYLIDDIPMRQDWWERAYPDLLHRSSVVKRWQTLRSGGRIDEEIQIVRKDGEKRDIRFKAIPLPDHRILMTLRDVSDQKQSESRIAHLLSVISAIRNVNQLITREKDREALLRGVCEKLTETRGYDLAFIVQYSEEKTLRLFSETGMKSKLTVVRNILARGEMPSCMERAYLTSFLVVVENPAIECRRCPLSDATGENGALVSPLMHDKRLYGVIYVSMPRALVTDPEEQALFKEVVDDIALALNAIELEDFRNRQEIELARYRNELETMVEKRTEDLTNALQRMEKEISERKRVETALKTSEKKYAMLVDRSPDIIFLLNSNWDFIFLGGAIASLTGFSPDSLIGKNFAEIVCPSDMEKVRNHIHFTKTGKPAGQGIEIPFKTLGHSLAEPDASFITMDLSITELYESDAFIAFYGVARDMTEKRKIEAQLVRADRLASLGQLSSGIAHEIRNPLAGIRLFLDILRDPEKFDRSEQEKEILNDLIHNVERISGIIQRVLDFSKTSIGVRQRLDLIPLIMETIAFWEAKIRKSGITLELSLSQSLPPVLGDRIQIQQVLNNLILNAIEAMEAGGTLTVTTDPGRSIGKEEKGPIRLQVADTGAGIDAGNLENIFNPFFTTKPTGTGLGLAISHNIIEKHNGIMFVRSEVGRGTVFTVELPVWRDDITQ
jgi:PAS domain S-box-containing protein